MIDTTTHPSFEAFNEHFHACGKCGEQTLCGIGQMLWNEGCCDVVVEMLTPCVVATAAHTNPNEQSFPA